MTFEDQYVGDYAALAHAIASQPEIASWGAAIEIIGSTLVERGWRPPAPLSDPAKPVLGKFGQGEGAETARRAALRNYPKNAKVRLAVLQHVAMVGDHGITSDEITAKDGMLHLPSVKPRLIELRDGGWVERTGGQRPSPFTGHDVDVYRMTERGRDAYERQGAVA